MIEVISVRFRGGCKSYFFNPQGLTVQEGDEVIVETAQGAEFGTCVCGNHNVEEFSIIQPLRIVHRLATEEDRKTVERNRKREKDAFSVCEKKIVQHKLDMKLVNVECGFEGSKIIFFFTADGRVDFRELVKDLAAAFHARIELRQIGVRDEAKMLGGLGICGQPFCCKRFLDDFQPVSIKMAKTQNLSLNPTKISGSCGRLMCCLKYEQHAYEDAMKRMPKNDSFVQTPDGPGNISAINLVRECVTVRLDETPEMPKTYSVEEIIVLRNGKGSRDGIAIPDRPAHLVKEAELDDFGMAIEDKHPQMRQFRNSPPLHREAQKEQKAEAPKQRDRRNGQKDAARPAQSEKQGAKAPAKQAEGAKPSGERKNNANTGSNTGNNNTGNRRPHRGSRGRGGRGGDKANQNKEKVEKTERTEKKEPRTAPQQPRPVRFGSSMPIAPGAATPNGGAAGGEKKEGGKNPRKGRRPMHRGGRGGNRGGNKPAEGGKEN